MELPFLDCNIFSVHNLPITEDEFYMIENVYQYNSLTSGIFHFTQTTIQIPDFEIKNLHLLNEVDTHIVNKYGIPILKRIININPEIWEINLSHYENFKLQSNSV